MRSNFPRQYSGRATIPLANACATVRRVVRLAATDVDDPSGVRRRSRRDDESGTPYATLSRSFRASDKA